MQTSLSFSLSILYICMFAHTHDGKSTCTHPSTSPLHTHTHTYMCMHTHTHTHTHTPSHIQTHTDTHPHTYTAPILPPTHIHIFSNTYMCMHIHTHTDTHPHTYNAPPPTNTPTKHAYTPEKDHSPQNLSVFPECTSLLLAISPCNRKTAHFCLRHHVSWATRNSQQTRQEDNAVQILVEQVRHLDKTDYSGNVTQISGMGLTTC